MAREPRTPMNDPTRSSRRGFTLVELLVVMSVIAILAGILVPILAAVRQTARRAGTKNTISQVGAALRRYSADWGLFPPDSVLAAPAGPPDPHTNGMAGAEFLYYYLCTPNLSAKHPYYEAQLNVQTCDFTFTGTGRTVQPTGGPNGSPEIADNWMYPIYYDLSDTSTAHHNLGTFDLWSGGKNLMNDNGAAGSDDITNW